jgi:hypothetical protein
MCVAGLFGCGEDSHPGAPIEALIAAARNDDPGLLAGVCVDGVKDSDALRVCSATREDPATWALVRAWFSGARIVKVSEIHGPQAVGGGDGAGAVEVVIEVEMGPDKRIIPMTVTNRGGRWYLDRF